MGRKWELSLSVDLLDIIHETETSSRRFARIHYNPTGLSLIDSRVVAVACVLPLFHLLFIYVYILYNSYKS